jgi:hypothetical protein
MSVVSQVLDRARLSATTVNQLNQTIIALENIITPSEAQSINESMTERADPQTNMWDSSETTWRDQFAVWSTLKGFSYSHEFVRVWNRPSATLYKTTGFNRKTPKKLVVLFTGGAHRMMLPSWIFLAHLPRMPLCVLLVRGREPFYEEGLPGITEDFPSTVDWIRQVAADRGLVVDTVMGCSAGALPALRAGYVLGANRRLVFGLPTLSRENLARFPITERKNVVSDLGRDDGTGLTLFVGGLDARDVAVAAEARTVMPRAHVVTEPGAIHTVVEPLARRGELHRLLRIHSAPWWRRGL